jgi:hypothetical protein
MLERYDAEEDTVPNLAPLPADAFPRFDFPVTVTRPVSRLRTGFPYFVGGLALGGLVPAVAWSALFLVDLGSYGAFWYAAGVLGAAGYIGVMVGVVAGLSYAKRAR